MLSPEVLGCCALDESCLSRSGSKKVLITIDYEELYAIDVPGGRMLH